MLSIIRIQEKIESLGQFRRDPATAIAIAGVGISFFGQRKAAKQREKERDFQNQARDADLAQQKLEQQRERRRQVREARELRGRAVNAAAIQGATESSVTAGTTGGIQSQLSGNLGFLASSSANISAINTALAGASGAAGKAAKGDAIANLGKTIFSNSEQIARSGESIGTIFTGA